MFVSTHLGEVLQGERLGHVVELRATHGFGHGQHSQTVGGGQLLLWKPAKSADGETNVDGGREQKKKKNARLIEADGGENFDLVKQVGGGGKNWKEGVAGGEEEDEEEDRE